MLRRTLGHVVLCCDTCVVRQSMIAEEKEAAKLAAAAAAEEDKNIYRMEEVMAHQHKLLMQMERFGHPHGLR